MTLGASDKEAAGLIRLKNSWEPLLKRVGVFWIHRHNPTRPPHTPPTSSISRPLHTPRVFGLHPVSNGISGGTNRRETALLGSRQAGMGARCCWAQRNRPLSAGNAAGLALSWRAHTHTHTHTRAHTMYKIQAPKVFWQLNASSWGPGWDRVGVSDWHNSEENRLLIQIKEI